MEEKRMKKGVSLLGMMFVIVVILVGGSGKGKEVNQSEASITPVLVQEPPTAELQVFIAASLKNAMEEIQTHYKELHPEVNLVFNTDSSGTLQKQIEEGVTCDIFFSAAMKQMDVLKDGVYVIPDSVVQLLENKVVLIKPLGAETLVTGFENITKATNIALAGEDVPVGAYAREIFTSLGILDQVMAMEINECTNVIAVLSAISEGSNEVGIVYATDAKAVKDTVEIIAEAPVGSLVKSVIYPVALIKNEQASENELAAAKEFLAYLESESALEVLEAHGFTAYKD